MLKHGCTLPNLANTCLHGSTSAKNYPFTDSVKDLFSEDWEDMVARPSIEFTRQAVVNKIHMRKSTKVCKSNNGTLLLLNVSTKAYKTLHKI